MDDAALNQLLKAFGLGQIVVDTNLMLLLVVGTHDISLLSSHRRTRQFSPADFALLVRVLSRFPKWFTFPNILTEVDNLTRQSPKEQWAGLMSTFERVTIRNFERYIPSIDIARGPFFAEVGLTDSAILEASKDSLILTTDHGLAGRIIHLKRAALNFNHIRLA